MNKKIMLLALTVVSAALFALPAVASATPAHISETENFEITSTTTASLEDDGGSKIECHGGVSGTGSFTNTTTGHINLKFTGCTSSGINCNSAGQESGVIVTTALPFHLITIAAHSPGVLITPNSEVTANHYATFNCTIFVKKTVTGNGVIGTITEPTCDTGSSTTATLRFEEGATTGHQKHTTHTGVDYHLFSNGTKAAMTAEGQIHFKFPKTIDCT